MPKLQYFGYQLQLDARQLDAHQLDAHQIDAHQLDAHQIDARLIAYTTTNRYTVANRSTPNR